MASPKTPLLAVGALVGLGVVLFLAFGVFGVHTLFIDDKVDEAGPVFASGAAPSGIASDETTAEMAAAMTDAMQDEPAQVIAGEPMPEMADTEPAPGGEPAPEIVTLKTGLFVDRSHPTTGVADVLNDGSTQRFLRFENFETDNGPDLNVYLSTAAVDAPAGEFDDDFVDLGDLKGNIGSQNYEIPEGVDLDVYSTVVIWCVRFGVAFGAAPLG